MDIKDIKTPLNFDIKNAATPIKIELGRRLSIVFRNHQNERLDYPSSRMQKGLILSYDGTELAEEGLGFGVPLLKYGDEDVFPGNACVKEHRTGNGSILEVDYELNLVKRLSMNGRRIKSRTIHRLKAYFGRLHREFPQFRRTGTWLFGNFKHILRIKPVFTTIPSAGTVRVVYDINVQKRTINIGADLTKLKKEHLTEMIVANEQGANYFDYYRDSSGLDLKGTRVGTWDEVHADCASFVDLPNDVMFTLQRIDNSKMYRGRELEAGRLAWSGLIYVLPPNTTRFSFDIKIGEAR